MGVSWSSCPLLLAAFSVPLDEGSRVDVVVVPLAGRSGICSHCIDAESDVVIHSSWQLVVQLMEGEDGVIHSSWQLVIPLMEGQDGDGGENNVKTELALFSFWLVFILSCYQCCVQSRTVLCQCSMGLSRISCLQVYRC